MNPNSDSLSRDWRANPKFRHNLWTTYDAEPDVVYLTVSHSKFAVKQDDAATFLQMRPHCTGHNTVGEVAEKSGVAEARVRKILGSLVEAEVVRPDYRPLSAMSAEEVRAVLFSACRIWSEQLAETYIASDILSGKLTQQITRGWLLETYHYIRSFPDALERAARSAAGELRHVLEKYSAEERGHEDFILQCLVNVGFKRAEVTESIPLVSTQLIHLLMRDLYTDCPAAALLVASVVEAGDVDPEQTGQWSRTIAGHYGIPADALLPYEQHIALDASLNHGKLAERYAHLLVFRDETQLHNVCNRIHDIKHAFDLQSLEIKDYYTHIGNYVPRQYVDLFGI
jgi:pyrroloquinoline quinone (PQQ) biosynthesis protein C